MDFSKEIDETLELPILKMTSLVISLGCFAALFLNIVLGLAPSNTYLAGCGCLVFGSMYYLSAKSRNYGLIKLAFVTITFVYVNLAWLYNYGFSASIAIVFLLWYTFSALILTSKGLKIWSIIFTLDLALLFFLESKYPGIVGEYPTEKARLADGFFSLIIALIVTYFYTGYSKRSFLREFFRAKKADKLKTSFLANLSHEIRTPLNAILGFSELLIDPDSRDNIEQRLQVIYSNSMYLHTLIEDILDVARIESDDFPLVYESRDLGKFLIGLSNEYSEITMIRCGERIQIHHNIPPSELLLRTDFKRLEQIIRNLLENALKFTEKGSIIISLSENEDTFVITIQDTGVGIKKEDLQDVFQRFVTIKSDLTKTRRGVGIGLFLCKRLVEVLGGRISVTSRVGKGSTFSFTLPR